MTLLRGTVVGVELEEGLRLLSGACGESSFGEEAGHVVRLRRELVETQLSAHRLPYPLVVGTPGLTIGYKDVDSDMCYGFLGEHPAPSPLPTAVVRGERVAQEGHQRLHARHLGEDTPPERSRRLVRRVNRTSSGQRTNQYWSLLPTSTGHDAKQ